MMYGISPFVTSLSCLSPKSLSSPPPPPPPSLFPLPLSPPPRSPLPSPSPPLARAALSAAAAARGAAHSTAPRTRSRGGQRAQPYHPAMSSVADFVPQRHLGSGASGVVRLARRIADGRLYALKELQMPRNPNEASAMLQESHILASIEHPFVIRYYDSFVDNSSLTLYLVME